jgi:putative transposase
MVVIDTHLARGSSNGGDAFHDRGGPYGRTKGAKRIVAVDVAGLPVGALVVPASTHENRASDLMLAHLTRQGAAGRLELVLVDRVVTAGAARTLGRKHEVEVRRVGGDDKQPVFRPIRHAWRVEVAHGRLGRSRRLAKSFENSTGSATGWLQVACIATTLRHLSRGTSPSAPRRAGSLTMAPVRTARNAADPRALPRTLCGMSGRLRANVRVARGGRNRATPHGAPLPTNVRVGPVGRASDTR